MLELYIVYKTPIRAERAFSQDNKIVKKIINLDV